ncbi:MAG: hypothetical protein EHM62_05210 [Methylococcus sp.]|jgi:hypothetical protein|nr:MAG: hypothetical protein EHM62_05210 [Methylococcus sp.]
MFSLDLFSPPLREGLRPWPALTVLLCSLAGTAILQAAPAYPADTYGSALPDIEGTATYRERMALPP